MAEQTQQPEVDNNKVEKEFKDNMERMVALFRGKENLFPGRKVTADTAEELVTELLQEQKIELAETFKTKAKALLDSYFKFNQEKTKAEKEYNKMVVDKKKEFTGKMKEIFGMIDNMKQIEDDYATMLRGVSEPESAGAIGRAPELLTD